MKFGIRLTVQGEMGATSSGFEYALNMARIAEDLGFDSVWIPDHVENAHLDRSKPILEYWTTITAIGALTKRVRLGRAFDQQHLPASRTDREDRLHARSHHERAGDHCARLGVVRNRSESLWFQSLER